MNRIIAALACAGLLGSAAVARGEPTLEERAGALIEEGQTLLDAGDAAAAVARFEEAYGLVPHPVLRFNLGQAHRLAGNRQRALEHYRAFLATGERGRLAELSERYVEELEAEAASAPVEPPAVLEPVAGDDPPPEGGEPTAVPPGSLAPEETERGGRRMTPLTWTLTGVGAASLGAGLAVGGSAYSKVRRCRDAPGGTCESDAEVDRIRRRLIAGDVLVGVSVAALAVAGALYLMSDDRAEAGPLSVAPARGGGAVVWQGRF